MRDMVYLAWNLDLAHGRLSWSVEIKGYHRILLNMVEIITVQMFKDQ